MGYLSNLIIFSVTFSFFLFLLVGTTTYSSLTGSSWEQYVSSFLMSLTVNQLGLFAIVGAGIALSIIQPNPYTTFSGVLFFLLGFTVIVSDVLGQFQAVFGLDPNLKLFITALTTILIALALLDWFRTGTQL